MSDYNELEIEIFHATGNKYTVRAHAPDLPQNPPGVEEIEVDFNDSEIKEPLERIEKDDTDETLFREFGSYLFERLFIGQIRDLYITSLANAQSSKNKKGLQIRLHIADNAHRFFELPWMLLYYPQRGWWLGGANAPLHQRTPLSYEVRGNPLAVLTQHRPLKILVVASNPINLEVINVSAELQRMEVALQGLENQGLVRIEKLLSSSQAPVTREILRGRLVTWRPHIIHFICHGPQSRTTAFSSPGLFLEHSDQKADFCRFDAFLDLLGDSKETIKLVILNACNSDGLAWNLAHQGIPAIGMVYDIHSRAAEPFAGRFYESIAAGLLVDEAVNLARSAIRENYNETERDWFAPVLFLPPGKTDIFDGFPGARKAIVEINSNPVNARILLEIEGKFEDQFKKTPDTLYLNVGARYKIRVEKVGYKLQEEEILINSIDPVQLVFDLEDELGQLSLRTTARGLPLHPVEVVWYSEDKEHNRNLGTTNNNGLLKTKVPVGPGLLEAKPLEAEGRPYIYRPRNRKINIKPGTLLTVNIEFDEVPEVPPPPPWLWEWLKRLWQVAQRILVQKPPLLVLLVILLEPVTLLLQHWWVSLHRIPSGTVYFPAGEFTKGGENTPLTNLMRKYGVLLDQKPEEVPLQGFYIDQYEVTNEEYSSFLKDPKNTINHIQHSPGEPKNKDHIAKYWQDSRYNSAQQPVVGVDWYDAAAYCAWKGKRLPTGNEWERAARGTDGRFYPWGNEFGEKAANTLESQQGKPTQVGQYSKDRSPEGVIDLAGNVSEWTDEDAQLGNNRSAKVVRGGSWNEPGEIYGLAFFNITADMSYRSENTGFRCAQDAKGSVPPRMIQIPSGSFKKGGENSFTLNLLRQYKYGLSSEDILKLISKPETVFLNEFALDIYEVTNQQYRRFLATSSGKGHEPDSTSWKNARFNQPKQPVVGVDWESAKAYCNWDEKRLPTEDELERAVRGTEGRRYPWGKEFEKDRCNTNKLSERKEKPEEVGKFKGCVSPEGIYDLVGNVSEWTSTKVQEMDGKEAIVIRGGSWKSDGELYGLGYFSISGSPENNGDFVGFRCAADPRHSWWERLLVWLGIETT